MKPGIIHWGRIHQGKREVIYQVVIHQGATYREGNLIGGIDSIGNSSGGNLPSGIWAGGNSPGGAGGQLTGGN